MTDYERIKQMCLDKGHLWEDPDFPANQSSAFYHQTPSFNFEWKRPRQIYQDPSFLISRSEFFDVIPGKLGDQWMVSCLGVLYLSYNLFQRVVPGNQKIDENYAGIFRFRIFWCGQWLEVLVDDRLPTVNGRLAFLQCKSSEQMWPALLEKAYAKLHGSYEALKYASLLDGLADMTGGITEHLHMDDVVDAEALQFLLKYSSVITAYHVAAAPEKIFGLKSEMNYIVLSIEQVETTKGDTYAVRVRRPQNNPHDVPIPFIGLNQDSWHTVPQKEKDRLVSTALDTWMLFSEFKKAFCRIEAVHLHDDQPYFGEHYLINKLMWQMKMHQSGWKRGVSAGGCYNMEFFHTNPQIQIVLAEPGTVIVSLTQHSIMEPKIIGFSIYRLPMPLIDPAKAQFFKGMKGVMNSLYSNSRQVTKRCLLEAGAYIVMPTTFDPREEANFTLKIYSSRPIKMEVLDNEPKMIKPALIKAPLVITEGNSFAQYEAAFLQLANEHKTIDPFELQELLDACLPNDYIKSCATIDTCRQIVLSLDKRGTGRISLSDFKDLMCSLKHYQLVFKNHSREKMGVLMAERFQDALKDVGFIVPQKVMMPLVLRYMRKDGLLRFGDFVSAVMHLYRAFDLYYKTDHFRIHGSVMNLTEWLTNVFMC